MKIAVVATFAAAFLVGRHFRLKSRAVKIDQEIYAKTIAEMSAIDQAATAIQEMVSEGLYENKSVAEIERDFQSLVMIYAAK